MRYGKSLSPIKDAEKWGFDVPEGAKEMSILFSGGLVRRPALILEKTVKVFMTH